MKLIRTMFSHKDIFAVLISVVLFGGFEFAYAAARNTPFTPGGTIDPGTDAEPCGPLDANCYPSVNPSGSDTQIQFNNGGVFGADENFTWTSDTNILYVSGTLQVGSVSSASIEASGEVYTSKVESMGPLELRSDEEEGVTIQAGVTSGDIVLNAPNGGIHLNGQNSYLSGITSSYLAVDESGMIISTTSPGSKWTASGSNIYYSTGNVGIGTTTPAAKLQTFNLGTGVDLFRWGNDDTLVDYTIEDLPIGTIPLVSPVSNGKSYMGQKGTTIMLSDPDSSTPAQIQFTDPGYNYISSIRYNDATGDLTFDGDGSNFAFSNANVGIGTTSPWRTLSVTGTVGFDGLTNSDTGSYLCLSASKEVTYSASACGVSSERFKHDITDISAGLSKVLQMRPVSFVYNEDISPSDRTKHLGFVAEEIDKIEKSLAVYDSDGNPYSVKYQEFIPVLVKAIQEQQLKIDMLSGNASSTSLSATLTAAVSDSLKSLKEWSLSKIQAVTGIFGNVYTEKLCVGKEGDSVCIDKDQLSKLLSNNGMVGTASTTEE